MLPKILTTALGVQYCTSTEKQRMRSEHQLNFGHSFGVG
jgi:hypothetical protein